MVYLIHFERKLYHAQHYIGFTDVPLIDRVERHLAGNGSKLLRAVTKAGIEWEVVRVWQDKDRKFERKLKNQKNSKLLCPICKIEKYLNEQPQRHVRP